MKTTVALLAAIVCGVVGSAVAFESITDHGTWPKSWPVELEPLRKQARTLQGSLLNLTTYEIPFTKREDFESAWPQLVKIKTKGAPVVLVRSPGKKLGTFVSAGVRILCPPRLPENRVTPPAPTPGATHARERWLWTTYLELVVDGEIVDLNRIALPADTPIIDQRFEDEQNKPRSRSGG